VLLSSTITLASNFRLVIAFIADKINRIKPILCVDISSTFIGNFKSSQDTQVNGRLSENR